MTTALLGFNANYVDYYLQAIEDVLFRGLAAKEIVCSITTGFRSIPSLRTSPGLNPYHASVADIGYGMDAALGTIKRIRQGESISFAKEVLVFDLDTLQISEEQIRPNFELVVKRATPETFYLIDLSKYYNVQISIIINEAIGYGKSLFGTDWEKIRKRIQRIQAVPRL